MVIRSFYQFLIGFDDKDQKKYAFLTRDGHLVPLNASVHSLFYHRDAQMIYGVWNRNGKDVIGRTELKSERIDFSALFTLSNKRLSHTTVSPDNQKIAFLTTDETTQETQLRIISREEFGWFPLPFIRFPVALSSLCFCSSDLLMYTDTKGTLRAARLYKPVRIAEISPQGHTPAYNDVTKSRAFIQNGKIFISGAISTEIETENASVISFSKNGKELFFADNNALYRYDLSTKEKTVIFRSSFPIVFIAEL